MATNDYQKTGKNKDALFSLTAYRGEGMLLLAMNWKNGKPPMDFVGFSIEYKEPEGTQFFALKNRISFLDAEGKPSKTNLSSLQSPFQKFRWVHFPRNAEQLGDFCYRVKPVFMNADEDLSYGEAQTVDIELNRETYPNRLNVSFTRGYIASQSFVDTYEPDGGIPALLPADSKAGLGFQATHPKADKAFTWMGFEARKEILGILDAAINDPTAEVRVTAYDLNQPEIVDRLVTLGSRLKVIIDDSKDHAEDGAAENEAAKKLTISTGGQVKRQHMSKLQHNKTIVVKGSKLQTALCGSTNFSWRGLYVQANNAVTVHGAEAVRPFWEAFEQYWTSDDAKGFGITVSANWCNLSLDGIDAKVSFSPHSADNTMLGSIANDIWKNTQSSLFYSLAFLYQTEGPIREVISILTAAGEKFIYGVSDKRTGGIYLQKPNGSVLPVYPSEISKGLPEPFKSEPTGGRGVRMHHKFIVIDFDKPTARVYTGSYNFSGAADKSNGENLLMIRDRKIAVSYMIEGLRIFDHYHFRVAQNESKAKGTVLALAKPPRTSGETAWWEEYYTDKLKIRDRELFG